MLAVIFVYPDKQATFKVGGAEGAGETEPLKRLPLGPATDQPLKYLNAEVAIAAGQTAVLRPGIYGTRTERDMALHVTAVAGTAGTDYDIVVTGDEKDPWLQIIAQGIASKDARIGRVLAAFPTLTDADLRTFFASEPRSISG